MRERPLLVVVAAALGLLCAPSCSSPPASSDGGADLAQARPPVGNPITGPMGSWQWVDFPDTVCDDGKPTGAAVRLTGSPDVMIYFMGGGACWDAQTCLVLNTAVHGPFGQAQWDLYKLSLSPSVLGDGTRNLFHDYNMVFVPYCTGDIHAGDNVAMYSTATGPRAYDHKGHANAQAVLFRLGATFPGPRKLVVTGSSAGGFGAGINHDLVRQYFPTAQQAFLIDDSGPVMIGDAINPTLRAAVYQAWGLDRTLGAQCPQCKDDFSAFIPMLSAKYPNDRMALLSYTQDGTIRQFLGLSADAFQAALYDLAARRLDVTPNFRYFFVTGTTHTMLLAPDGVTSQGVKLDDWLLQMVDGSQDWKAIKP